MAQPAQYLRDAFAVGPHRRIRAEWIDQDQPVIHFRHESQNGVRQNAQIRTDGVEQPRKQQPFQQAEGMVCHDHQWSLAGDAGQVGVGHDRRDVHGFEE